ncbi:MAG: TIGR00730 family Rossman fold protein [Bacteroidetes bacterium]|nr:TIGR00730 family Rossman fold protein [Bacteroidota bacterium]
MIEKSLAVFCGSQSGIDPMYVQHALELGELMAKNQIILVYGGGNKGMMGAVANGVIDNGGKVIGVIPELLLAWEAAHKGLTDLRVVADMHVRKRMMYDLCESAVVLPGGHGTLDELFEIVTWNNLKIHNKKIFILNTNGYYNPLIGHLQNMFEQGFLYEAWQDRIIVCTKPEEVIAYVV